jgi:hypothetical protein
MAQVVDYLPNQAQDPNTTKKRDGCGLVDKDSNAESGLLLDFVQS